MSKGTSYLAAYRMAKAQSMQVAYKQALYEIQDANAQAQAYATTIASLNEQILEYDKLKQKLLDAEDPAMKNEILQAEIALAQINERNNGNKIQVYKYADEEFDAPLRTESEIAQNASGRNTFYNSSTIGNLGSYIQTNHAAIFTGLTNNQKRDAALQLYDTIVREGNAAMIGTGGLTTQNKKDIRDAIIATSGVPVAEFSSTYHEAEKQKYIKGVLGNVTGATGSLRTAINEAKQTAATTGGVSKENEIMIAAAKAAAVDGFQAEDWRLLDGAMVEAYGDLKGFGDKKTKLKDLKGVLGNVTGATGSLRTAIDEAKQTAATTGGVSKENEIMIAAAKAAAVDGFQAEDWRLLDGAMVEAYGDLKGFGDKKTKLKDLKTPKERQAAYKELGLPTTIDELFQVKAVIADPSVVQAKRFGDELTRINTATQALETQRTQAMTGRTQAMARASMMSRPENLRERQAEIFAQTLSPEERQRYLTPEQMQRVARLEGQAVTRQQLKEEAKEKAVDQELLKTMKPEEINTMRAMALAVSAHQEEKEIQMSALERDAYEAMKEQINSGNITQQDVYKKAQKLGQEMGGLEDAQRNFAQTVASRIYLDLYTDLAAQMPAGAEAKQKIQKEVNPNYEAEQTDKATDAAGNTGF